MEMVDMVITRIWFSNSRSRNVNNFLQQPHFRLLGSETIRIPSISKLGNPLEELLIDNVSDKQSQFITIGSD